MKKLHVFVISFVLILSHFSQAARVSRPETVSNKRSASQGRLIYNELYRMYGRSHRVKTVPVRLNHERTWKEELQKHTRQDRQIMFISTDKGLPQLIQFIPEGTRPNEKELDALTEKYKFEDKL